MIFFRGENGGVSFLILEKPLPYFKGLNKGKTPNKNFRRLKNGFFEILFFFCLTEENYFTPFLYLRRF